MSIEAEVTLPLKLTEQEYAFILLLRSFDEPFLTELFQRLATEKREGTSGAQFVKDIDALRDSMSASEIEAFKQSLSIFDQIDLKDWE